MSETCLLIRRFATAVSGAFAMGGSMSRFNELRPAHRGAPLFLDRHLWRSFARAALPSEESVDSVNDRASGAETVRCSETAGQSATLSPATKAAGAAAKACYGPRILFRSGRAAGYLRRPGYGPLPHSQIPPS